jgi:hypothetical protein
MGQVRVGLYYFIIFLSDSNPFHLNLGQKFLTHTRPDQVTGRSNPTHVKQLINY